MEKRKVLTLVVDAIDSQGRYIVSVHELETTIMITSYAIDVDKGTIGRTMKSRRKKDGRSKF